MKKSEPIGDARDQLAVEAAADQNSQPLIAKGPYSGKQTAMPEGVDRRGRHIEAGRGARFADMFIPKRGSEAQSKRAYQTGHDGKEDALLDGVGGDHRLSLPGHTVKRPTN